MQIVSIIVLPLKFGQMSIFFFCKLIDSLHPLSLILRNFIVFFFVKVRYMYSIFCHLFRGLSVYIIVTIFLVKISSKGLQTLPCSISRQETLFHKVVY